ncbi:FtsX-like permease family protein [Streptomyces sp. BE20]|uniref:FtsX-like permease family protein n=1 Tax=Streptomyces sp. BE20 TaxID=3002525 RepID=UPI002E77A599|nr:FtsX-like permease family protein [Streptomyces sp. BE20]MEE1825306.1 FtsX-like permease family protein [Streptomyces sp. BE20]
MVLAGVRRRIGRHGLVLAALAVSILVATAVLSAVTGLAQSAATAGVRQRLDADAGRSVEVTARWTAPGLPAADRAVHSALVRTMAGTPFRTETAQRGIGTVDLPLPPNGRCWATETVLSGRLAVLPAPDRFAQLRSGTWPDAPEAAPAAGDGLRVALPETTADRLGLDSGSTTAIRTPGTGEPLRFTVTGVYRPDPDAAAFWTGLGGPDAAEQALVLVDGARLAALPGFTGRMLAVWLALPDTGRSSLSELTALRDRVTVFARSDTARSVYRGAEPALTDTAVRSTLPAAVDRQVVPVLTARAEIAVPLGLLALLASVVLVLTARRLADAVAGEHALQSSRGAGAARLLAAAAGEWALAAVPAAVGGVLLAEPLLAAVLRAVGADGLAAGDGRTVWWAAGFVLLVQGAALLLPLARQAMDPGAQRALRARSPRRLGLQRAGADLALLAVAAFGYFQLDHYEGVVVKNAGVGFDSSVDLTLVLAPLVMAVAGAVLMLRVLPAVGRLLERSARRARGLVLPLGAWRLSRDAGRQSVPVLVTLLAVACSSLAAGVLAALPTSDRDRAAYAVGADLRLSGVSGAIGQRHAALAALPGVTSLTPVSEQTAYLGTTVVQTVAVDTTAASAAGLPRLRPDQAARPLQELLAPLTAVPAQGLVLPGEPAALNVTVRASTDLPIPAPGLLLQLWIQDADGLTDQLTAPLPTDGLPHSLTFALADSDRRARPLTLSRLGIHFPGSTLLRSTLDLRLPKVTAVTATGERTDLSLPPGQNWARSGKVLATPVALDCPGTERRPTDDIASQAEACTWQSEGSDLLHTVIRSHLPENPPDPAGSDAVLAVQPVSGDSVPELRAVQGGAFLPVPPILPVLADRVLLDAVNARVGDTVPLNWERDGQSTQKVRITGEVDVLPGYSRGQGHLLLDVRALAAHRTLTGAAPPVATRWWLASSDPEATWAAVDGRGEFGRPQSALRVAGGLADDPFRAGLRCAWLLVLVTAPFFAVTALTLHAVSTVRSRRREFAVLRALGVRRAELTALLRAEQVAVTVLPVLFGGLLGLLLAALLLALTVLEDYGGSVFPAIVADPGRPAAVLTALAGGLLLTLAVLVLTRLLARVDLVRALRAGDDG